MFENLRIYGLHFRIRSSLLEHRIPKLLKLVELDHRAKDRISTLSGGMQRRLILTRALINDPDLLVFNEPTTGLDPQARHMIWSLIHRLKRNGKTILLTTHYDDIVIGELLWCASKSLVSGSAILAVAAVLGAVADWRAVLALPAIFLTGFCFAAPALIMTALAKGYEFFTFYLTLVMTPMFILCGVFYPTASLPAPMQTFVQFLPLTHAVALIRPLVVGRPVIDAWLHIGVLAVFGIVGTWVAVALVRRRLVL
ncbi:MAG TPA: ATP-binding cassette domain-containing protein [Gammaproteobacteria bacterium]|nr:ATP-binding cassette domain-containing protein [Gammaproteobacteria bacterium]